jgi:hypothetical protein
VFDLDDTAKCFLDGRKEYSELELPADHSQNPDVSDIVFFESFGLGNGRQTVSVLVNVESR